MTCDVESCSRPIFSRKWCQMHYTRWLRHGDPTRKLFREPAPIVGGRFALPDGSVVLIDEADAELVGRYVWRRNPNGYVVTGIEGRSYGLHRLLLPDAETVDHINHDNLDNRRCNLRPATQAQNSAWRRRIKPRRYPLKGVRQMGSGRWRSCITVDGQTRHLGSFDTAEDAARAYDAALIEAWGDFAATNERLGLLPVRSVAP